MADNVVNLTFRRLCRKLPRNYMVRITRREDSTMHYTIPGLAVPIDRETMAAVAADLTRVLESIQSKMTDAPAAKSL